jgi:23S rRNA (adenine2503-C2)-methyltransferase
MIHTGEKPFLMDFDYSQLESALQSVGEPKFRAQQIWEGIFHSQVLEVDSITAIPVSLRNKLNEKYIYLSLTPISEYHSKDQSTEKILFETFDKKKIETVLMKYNTRNTLCISTQSGCAMGCVFCATGQMGFYKNLSSSEIVEQVLFFSRRLKKIDEKVTNIVFMGMGEPFHNYESTMKAIDILGNPKGMNIGARRMTISTVGVVPQIIRFADENRQVNLAVSLHTIDNSIRNNMMPINKKYPVEKLLKACAYYIEKTNRRISFEWALIEGENDSTEIARKLAKRLRPLLCHVNLIQLNPTEKYSGTGSSNTSAQEFKVILENAGIPCTIRLRRGIDIHAGCGQLATSVT